MPLTKNKNYLRAINCVRALGYVEPAEPQKRVNPFTNRGCVLEPLAVMLHDFITSRKGEVACGKTNYQRVEQRTLRLR
jgi:hypothetical protein